MNRKICIGYLMALGSAALVGLFTVLNKWLLGEEVPALSAAAWTYTAAGIALLPWALRLQGFSLRRPWILAAWLLAGSIAGPGLYFMGLKLTSGIQGVLMINLEAIFTAFLAFVIFKEPVTRIAFVSGLAVIAGGIWISWPTSRGNWLAGETLGNLLMALGYLGWATENNLGRLLGEDIPPVTLVFIKALAAGAFMALLAVIFGQSLIVSWHVIPGIAASGAIALGASLALFYLAMQRIGAGRTGIISSTSTFWGILAALLLLQESLSLKLLGGGILMVLGLFGFAWEAARKA